MTETAPAMNLPDGRFSGRVEFAQLIRLAFAAAAGQGWQSIILSDCTFEDWPLGERVVAQSLNDWSMSGRKLTMLARNYDEVGRRHARFGMWRRTWSHIVDCRANTAISHDDFPSALWSPVWMLRRLDLSRSTGVSSIQPGRRIALKEQLEACLKLSSPAFASTTLGL